MPAAQAALLVSLAHQSWENMSRTPSLKLALLPFVNAGLLPLPAQLNCGHFSTQMHLPLKGVVAGATILSTIVSLFAGFGIYDQSMSSLSHTQDIAMQSLIATVQDVGTASTDTLVAKLNMSSFDLVDKSHVMLETMSAGIGPDMIWFDNAPQIFWGILKAMPDLYSVQVFAFFENNTCSMNSMWFDTLQSGERVYLMTVDKGPYYGNCTLHPSKVTIGHNVTVWMLDSTGNPVASAKNFSFVGSDRIQGSRWRGMKYWRAIDGNIYMYSALDKAVPIDKTPSGVVEIWVSAFFVVEN